MSHGLGHAAFEALSCGAGEIRDSLWWDGRRTTRREDPDGDRVVVTFDGKFLDYRW